MSNEVMRERSLSRDALRAAIQEEYAAVAHSPGMGFHFHTGRPLARMLGYRDAWLSGVPQPSIASFAGTGNPFAVGEIRAGEHVVDVGCGAGMDSMIAASMVGAGGMVVGVDMTPAMLAKARSSAAATQVRNLELVEGHAESLPVSDAWADVIISNGVLNLLPDKTAALREMARVLKPSGRLQIADIIVQKALAEEDKADISLWTG